MTVGPHSHEVAPTLINQFLDDGMTLSELSRKLGRDPSGIAKVRDGIKPGKNLVGPLRAIMNGAEKATAPRRKTKSGKTAKVRGKNDDQGKATTVTPSSVTTQETSLGGQRKSLSVSTENPTPDDPDFDEEISAQVIQISEDAPANSRISMTLTLTDGTRMAVGVKVGYSPKAVQEKFQAAPSALNACAAWAAENPNYAEALDDVAEDEIQEVELTRW